MNINWKKKKNSCLVSVLCICMLGACVTAGTGCSADLETGSSNTETAIYEDTSEMGTQSMDGQTIQTSEQAASDQDPAAGQDPAAAGQDQTAAGQDPAAAGQDPAAQDQTADQAQTAAGEGQAEDDGDRLLTEDDITYNIVLDPGHGGEDSGANGWNSSEKRLNLLIGKYLKKELEQYEHVKAGMTRKKDVYVKIHDRVKIARKKHADLLISLHNDSWDVNTPYDNGSSVLVAQKGTFRKELALQEARLGRNILSELEDIGLVKRGLVRKKSDIVPPYPDGSLGDYHAIVRDGMKYGLPSIIVEHSFCDSEHDYNEFLSSNEKLQKLAAADARGIARYLGLKRKGTGEVLPPVVVDGKKQRCKADKLSDISLFRKRYYNTEYEKQQDRQQVEDENAALEEKEEKEKKQEQTEEEDPAAMEAKIHAVSIARKNAAAQKEVPKVILISLFVGAGLIVIKEFDIGFTFAFRFRKRNDRYDPWKRIGLTYNYK